MLCLLPILVAAGALTLPAAADASVLAGVSSDTLTITGDGAADRITLRLAPGAPQTLQLDTGTTTLSFDRANFTRIVIRSGAGDDDIRIDESNGAFTDAEQTTIESGAGNDVVAGGRAAETIAAGDDNDLVDAGRGDDAIFLGAGNDTALQGADDGSDTLDGQSGTDAFQTAGSAESEEFTAQAVGNRARISRDTSSSAVSMTATEIAEISAGGGQDLVDVGDLTGTGVNRVDADLGLADGARDTVFAQATANADSISVSALGDTARVLGLGSELRIDNASATDDRLTVQGGGGGDKVTAVGSVSSMIATVLEGNEGIDFLTGGSGGETLRGGPDDDVLRGNQGVDTIEGGDGGDLLIWTASDGSDVVRNDPGQDRLRVPNSGADDSYELSRVGSGVRVQRGTALLDADAEVIDIGLGIGADKLRVRDLAGTVTHDVVADLGTADLKVDDVTIDGSDGADAIRVRDGGDFHEVTGLAARVSLIGAEPGDRLTINSGFGDDQVDASLMTKDQLQPFLNGGGDKDVLVGSPGQDVVSGGSGNDVAFLGGGLDTFNWSAGDGSDVVEGGLGDDFLNMNGSGANEAFAVSPIGGRIRVTRDVGNFVMDTGDVERFNVNPAGGADTTRVDDLSGTDAKVVTWELAPFRGTTATDGARDSVLINGTFGNDNIKVGAGGQQVRVTGLAAAIEINRSDPTLDTLHIDTRLGTDPVVIDPQAHNLIGITTS
jgi:Ca2+-binding RTX toxin-like protein